MKFMSINWLVRSAFIFTFTICALLTANGLSADGHYEERNGDIDGVLYKLLVPKEWNGNVIFFNHGLFFEDLPLSVYLEYHRAPYPALIEEGWMVASSSYRRNGVIIGDAAEDVLALYDFISKEYSKPKRSLAIGETMGGAVTLRIVEARDDIFDAALILGHGVLMKDPASPYKITYRPKVPVLFMSNQSEIDHAEKYFRKAKKRGADVALWRVARDGHINFNGAEFTASARALETWLDTGEIARDIDATREADEQPSVARFADGGAYAEVTKIVPTFGNLEVNFVGADFRRLGIALMQKFTIEIQGKEYEATHVTAYADVPQGEWLAFNEAQGKYVIAINFKNASDVSGAKAGDTVFIKKR